MILSVKDNGIGITKEQITAHRSLGILGMSERARSLKGKLVIKTSQGQGTEMIVSIPVRAERMSR